MQISNTSNCTFLITKPLSNTFVHLLLCKPQIESNFCHSSYKLFITNKFQNHTSTLCNIEMRSVSFKNKLFSSSYSGRVLPFPHYYHVLITERHKVGEPLSHGHTVDGGDLHWAGVPHQWGRPLQHLRRIPKDPRQQNKTIKCPITQRSLSNGVYFLSR